MVTFELAVGMLTASLVVGVACWLVGLVVLQGRCADVAGQVARQEARADKDAASEARGRAPRGAQVDVDKSNTQVRVVVTARSSLGAIGPIEVHGAAVAKLEPGVAR